MFSSQDDSDVTLEACSLEDLLQDIIARLHALYAIYRSAHWQAWGTSYYGDHLLFQRLYEPLDDEIDTLAERMIPQFGSSCVDPLPIAQRTAEHVAALTELYPCPYERGIVAEQELIGCIDGAMVEIEGQGARTLGWDDFLGKLTSQHEEHLYLLTQRLS